MRHIYKNDRGVVNEAPGCDRRESASSLGVRPARAHALCWLWTGFFSPGSCWARLGSEAAVAQMACTAVAREAPTLAGSRE